MSIKYLIILMIFSPFSPCQQGCLKCQSNGTCIICDTTKFYKLSGTTCVLVSIPNCTSIDIDGICQACDNNYFVEINTKKCQRVDTAKLVDQCMAYD